MYECTACIMVLLAHAGTSLLIDWDLIGGYFYSNVILCKLKEKNMQQLRDLAM